MQIFLSHPHLDVRLAEVLDTAISDWSANLVPVVRTSRTGSGLNDGFVLPDALREKVRQSTLFIYFRTSNSHESHYQQMELHEAKDQSIERQIAILNFVDQPLPQYVTSSKAYRRFEMWKRSDVTEFVVSLLGNRDFICPANADQAKATASVIFKKLARINPHPVADQLFNHLTDLHPNFRPEWHDRRKVVQLTVPTKTVAACRSATTRSKRDRDAIKTTIRNTSRVELAFSRDALRELGLENLPTDNLSIDELARLWRKAASESRGSYLLPSNRWLAHLTEEVRRVAETEEFQRHRQPASNARDRRRRFDLVLTRQRYDAENNLTLQFIVVERPLSWI